MRVNNHVRRALEAAMGSLTLLNPDPASAVPRRKPCSSRATPAALPALDAALAKETTRDPPRPEPGPRRRDPRPMPRSPTPSALAAVADRRRRRGDQDALAPALGASRPVRQAVQGARPTRRSPASSAGSRSGTSAQNVWYGMSLGSVLLLAAIGLAITFGVMGVINMAHGEMVMLGAYTTFVVQEVIRTMAPRPVRLVAGHRRARSPSSSPGAVGIAIERGVIRFLYGRPLETLLATWGVSLILQQAVRTHLRADQPRGRHARPG